jgi:predicted transcriptional regulator
LKLLDEILILISKGFKMNNREIYKKVRGLDWECYKVKEKYQNIEYFLKDIKRKGFKTLEEVQSFVSDMKTDEQRINAKINKIQDSCNHETTHNVYHNKIECLDCLKTW